MVLIGIDQSFSNCVCVAYEEGQQIALLRIKTKPEQFLSLAARLIHIECEVKHFIEWHAPSLVAMEGYAMGKEFGREKMGELGGTIKKAVWKAKAPLCVIPPTTLKSGIANNGRASKNEMIDAVVALGFKPQDDNEADAIGLAILAERVMLGKIQVNIAAPAEYQGPEPKSPVVGSTSAKSVQPKRTKRRREVRLGTDVRNKNPAAPKTRAAQDIKRQPFFEDSD